MAGLFNDQGTHHSRVGPTDLGGAGQAACLDAILLTFVGDALDKIHVVFDHHHRFALGNGLADRRFTRQVRVPCPLPVRPTATVRSLHQQHADFPAIAFAHD
jgi:hypothetical protein